MSAANASIKRCDAMAKAITKKLQDLSADEHKISNFMANAETEILAADHKRWVELLLGIFVVAPIVRVMPSFGAEG